MGQTRHSSAAGSGIVTTLTGSGLSVSTSRGGLVTVNGIPNSISIDARGTLFNHVERAEPQRPTCCFRDQLRRQPSHAQCGSRGTPGQCDDRRVGDEHFLDTESGGTITINGSSERWPWCLVQTAARTWPHPRRLAPFKRLHGPGRRRSMRPSIGRMNITGQIDANITAGSVGPVAAGIIGSSTWTIGGIGGQHYNGRDQRTESDGCRGWANHLAAGNQRFDGEFPRETLLRLRRRFSAGAPSRRDSRRLARMESPTAFGSAATISSVVVGRGGV